MRTADNPPFSPGGETPPRRRWLDRRQVLEEGRLYWMGRRTQDLVLASAALAVLWPLMGLVALAVWLDSPGASPIFVQDRVGRDGRLFRLYKFRSMVPDAEARLAEVLDRNEMDGPVFKIREDPRVTRLGRFLRRTGIDELPQLVNIIKSDMSIVGPRPALPREVDQYGDYERQRLYVTPGLTCYWQIMPGRNQLSFAQWVELDLQYIQERSFWQDWKIIGQTFRTILRMYGA